MKEGDILSEDGSSKGSKGFNKRSNLSVEAVDSICSARKATWPL